MKRITESKIMQKLIAMLLVLMMFSSYLPALSLISFAAEEKSSEDIANYLDFDINWNEGGKETVGETNTAYGFDYKLIFNGTSTVFNNVKILIKDNDTTLLSTVKVNNLAETEISPKSQNASYSLISFGNKSSGKAYNGSGNIIFANSENAYNKEITATVSGTWNNPITGDVEEFSIEKKLNAQITPKKLVKDFTGTIESQKDIYGITKDEQVTRNTEDIIEGGRKVGYYATRVGVTYPIRLNSSELTQNLKLNITIDRISSGDSKLNDGYSINWNGLNTVLGEPTKTTNDDGSITYCFSKGQISDTYNKENTFSINKDFNIGITYTIPSKSSAQSEGSTTCTIVADLETNGWNYEKEYNKDEIATLVTKKSAYVKNNHIDVYSYTPGESTWDSINFGTNGNSYLQDEDMNNLINNRNLELSFRTSVNRNYGTSSVSDNATINYATPTITYVNDNKEVVTKSLTSNEFRLKSVNQGNSTQCSVLANGQQEMEFTNELTIPENININKFSIKVDDFLHKNYGSFITTYTLNADNLGLSDTELNNILEINVEMTTSGWPWMQGSGLASYYNENSVGSSRSFMELDIGDDFNFDASKIDITKDQERSLKLKMHGYEGNHIINKNPIFYVFLPAGFEYKKKKINVSMTNSPNITILENKVRYTPMNGGYLIRIPCSGIYDSNKDEEIDITVGFLMKATDTPNYNTIQAYMITDNECYISCIDNYLELTKLDGTDVNKCLYDSDDFSILRGSVFASTTSAGIDENNTFSADPSKDAGYDNPILESPFVAEPNSDVYYESSILATQDKLKNITILSRLPIANNTYINDPAKKIIDDEGLTQISLQNLDFSKIKVVAKNSNSQNESTINNSNYKIYFSNDETADLESGTYFEYEEGVTDLSNVKNIKVVFNDNFELTSGNKLSLRYVMQMPDVAEGVVGSTTAVQYKTSDSEELTTLYSPAAYVKTGKRVGNITINKQFEGFDVGVAPDGVSISGIQFKLKYFDEEANEYKYLKDKSSGEDLIAETDGNGVAKFENVPEGDYLIDEVTEFDNYFGISQLTGATVNVGETVTVTAVNKLKRGNLTITKQWKDLAEEQEVGEVSFEVNCAGQGTASETYIAKTDKNTNQVTVYGVPYGNCTVKESSNISGWNTEQESYNITIDKEGNELTVVNEPSTATLQFTKTVPAGETVDGLKFHITGLGMLGQLNKADGSKLDTNTDLTITIGEDYSSNENITVEKSENDTKATVTIKNLYLGYYEVEEIEIPTVNYGGEDVEKYVTLKKSRELTEKGEIGQLNIENNYKTGTIKIHKTAKLKDGNEYTEIGDLSVFRVHVTGTSAYGHDIDTYINLDEDGNGSAKFEIGEYTITEEAEGYTTYYGVDNTASQEPVKVKLDYNEIVTQELYNEHTGVGYVRVEKSLEGVTNPQTVVNNQIQFRVTGKNIAGGKVDEIIKIDKVDTEKNVAYGISNAIPTDGEYVLEEVESTIPNYYEGIEPMDIDIRTSNTAENPLVIKAQNNRILGDLEMLTETNPSKGPLNGITYRVTEVQINSDGSYTKIGTPVTVDGDATTSFAKLEDISAGYYLVEQLTVPDGWQKDVNQVVEVPSYNIGYANFVITKIKELQENTVTINKVVLNSNDEVATDEEIENAKLNKNESFEVRLTNIATKEEYYVFTSTDEPAVIRGLDAGTYRIEEIYKPKYVTEGYYNNIVVEPNQIVGLTENIEKQSVEERIPETDGGYLFTINLNDNRVEDATITIKNKINTDFGFGGQNSVDNYSKNDITEEDIQLITKAVIYVVDENDNAISGVKFNLIDNKTGKIINLVRNGSEFEIDGKKMTIKGLPAGSYTLQCSQVPEGYLKPDDKQITVFKEAVQVARVEVQRNIPRGSITLSTVYKTDDNETKYVSRSKYKVLDTTTGELVRFTRTSTGNYKKSNLNDASPLITLKSGTVEITGIETGKYEIGIVDITKGYGIIKDLPETVDVIENANQNVCVEVVHKEIDEVAACNQMSMYLDESGNLYTTNGTKFVKVNIPVPVKRFSSDGNSTVAIATDGTIWSWGRNSYGQLGNGTTTNITTPTSVFQGNFVDVQISSYNTLLLNDLGQVYAAGRYVGDGTSDTKTTFTPINEFTDNNVTIKKLAKSDSWINGVIDTEGKVWIWGYDDLLNNTLGAYEQLTPVCISETTDLKNKEIVDLFISDYFIIALDKDGNVWIWGSSSNVCNSELTENCYVPTKIDSSYFGNAKIKLISGYYAAASVVDEYGKVWTWGYGANGELGNGKTESSNIPICISDDEQEPLYGVKIKEIDAGRNSYGHILAVDESNRIWYWGGYYGYGEENIGVTSTPKIATVSYNAHLEYNLKFKDVVTSGDGWRSFAIDENGNVWAWGYNQYGELGSQADTIIVNPTRLDIPGDQKIQKVAIGFNWCAYMLSEDGEIYITGADRKMIRKLEDFEDITGSDLLEGIEFVDICDNTSADGYALDSNGKLYKINVNTYTCTINCISDEIANLGNVKFSKLGNYMAISTEGDLYTYTGSKLSSGNNFVDLKGYFILDSEGKLWTVNGSSGSNLKCVSDDSNNPLYKNYRLDENYKITDIYNVYAGYTQAILKDSNNELWYYEDSDTNNVYKMEGIINGAYYGNIYADEIPKDIISLYGYLLVDSYGQIWVYQNVGNYYGEAGNGTTTSITAPVCLNNKNDNVVYNVNMKRVISDSYVVDEAGNLYNYTTNTAAKVGISPIEFIENKLGVKIVDSCEYVPVSATTDYTIAVDEYGKLWEGDSTGVKCLTDVVGTQLYEKYTTDPEFKIVKTYMYEKSKYFVDNYGKVWAWGTNTFGQLGNGKTTTVSSPACISDIEGIQTLELVNGCVIAKDNTGKVWVWGRNSYGRLGNGTTSNITKPYCINTEKLGGKTIKDSSINTYGILLCTDGSVYVSGDKKINNDVTAWTLVGTCEGAERVLNYGSTGTKDFYIISGSNKTWTMGIKNLCGIGDSSSTTYVKVPTLVLSEFEARQIKTASASSSSPATPVTVYDYSGNTWTWAVGGTPQKSEQDDSEIITKLYGELTEETRAAFIKMRAGLSTGVNYVVINNKIWLIKSNDIENAVCITEDSNSELYNKQIISSSNHKVIDSDGKLYVWSEYTGLTNVPTEPMEVTSKATFTEQIFKSNHTVINIPDGNNLYGIKVKELINDYFVIDENDNIWYFPQSGKPVNLSKCKEQGEKNLLYGKKIINTLGGVDNRVEYVVTEDNTIWYLGGETPCEIFKAPNAEGVQYIYKNLITRYTPGQEFYVALDNQGNIWTAGSNASGVLGNGAYTTNNKSVCLNNIEGSELYNAKLNDANFKIEKVINNNAWLYAIDNSGKLWAWGANSNGYLGNGTKDNILSPTCISNLEGTALYEAFNADSSFKIVNVDAINFTLLDSNGEYWCIDSTTNTWKKYKDVKAKGDLLDAFTNETGFAIAKFEDSKNLIVGNNGKVYWNENTYHTNCEVISELNGIQDVYRYYSATSTIDKVSHTISKYLAYGPDGVYVMETDNNSITVTKVSTCNISKLITGYYRALLAVDDEGNLWGIGQTSGIGAPFTESEISFRCITTEADAGQCVLAGKKVKDVRYYSSGTTLVIDENDNMYAWGSLVSDQITAQSKPIVEYTKYDDVITSLYGNVDNDLRVQFTDMLAQLYLPSVSYPYPALVNINDNLYELKFVNNNLVATKVEFKEYAGGIGKITGVVGEKNIQTEDGSIYEIKNTIGNNYEFVKVDVPTPFEEKEITPIQIENVNIVKQTKYKALDDNGKLYVWDSYTGMSKVPEGIVCLTDEEYYVQPVYSNCNGWSVIKSQY